MKVISIRCKHCGGQLRGLEDDLLFWCPACRRHFSVGENGLHETDVLTPSDVKEADIYLPYYLIRFRDNDFYLPGYIMCDHTSVADPSYRMSVKDKSRVAFEKGEGFGGLRVPFSELVPLLTAYVAEFFKTGFDEKRAASLKWVLVAMPYVRRGKKLKDTVFGFELDLSFVDGMEEISRLYSASV